MNGKWINIPSKSKRNHSTLRHFSMNIGNSRSVLWTRLNILRGLWVLILWSIFRRRVRRALEITAGRMSKKQQKSGEMRMDLDTLSQAALSQFDTSYFNQSYSGSKSFPAVTDELARALTNSMAVSNTDLFIDCEQGDLPNFSGVYFCLYILMTCLQTS